MVSCTIRFCLVWAVRVPNTNSPGIDADLPVHLPVDRMDDLRRHGIEPDELEDDAASERQASAACESNQVMRESKECKSVRPVRRSRMPCIPRILPAALLFCTAMSAVGGAQKTMVFPATRSPQITASCQPIPQPT